MIIIWQHQWQWWQCHYIVDKASNLHYKWVMRYNPNDLPPKVQDYRGNIKGEGSSTLFTQFSKPTGTNLKKTPNFFTSCSFLALLARDFSKSSAYQKRHQTLFENDIFAEPEHIYIYITCIWHIHINHLLISLILIVLSRSCMQE